MYPLIEIKSIPIELQIKTTSATLEYTRGTAEMEISRSEQGGVDVKSRPIRVKLDTFEQRGGKFSAANAAVAQNVQPQQQQKQSKPAPAQYQPISADAGASAALAASVAQTVAVQPTQAQYQATAAYADQGQIQLSARIGQSIPQTAPPVSAQSDGGYTAPDTSPDTGVNVEWEDGAMEIRYAMDKLKFDWKIDQGEFKFTPGDIEISIAQKPSLTIKYTGGPIYVPRSADPNYRPVDVNA